MKSRFRRVFSFRRAVSSKARKQYARNERTGCSGGAPTELRAVALREFLPRLGFGLRSRWRLRRFRGGLRALRLWSRSRFGLSFPRLFRHFHECHLQIRERILDHRRLFVRKIAAGLLLDHGELVDKHFRQLEVHFALAGLWIRNLPEEKRRVL